MAITIEAVYENGILKPVEPLPLKEHEQVDLVIHTNSRGQEDTPVTPPVDARMAG